MRGGQPLPAYLCCNVEKLRTGPVRQIYMKVTIATVVLLSELLAAIAIPNLRQAMGRSKQKRTMADVRAIAMAWEARATDVNTYDVTPRRSSAAMKSVALRDLRHALTPTYLKEVPGRDAWGHPLQFVTSGQHYFIRSSGADLRFDHNVGPTTSFDGDIVFKDGVFLEYAEGV
jgi:type II secretory pathway pseudopilin PulG